MTLPDARTIMSLRMEVMQKFNKSKEGDRESKGGKEGRERKEDKEEEFTEVKSKQRRSKPTRTADEVHRNINFKTRLCVGWTTSGTCIYGTGCHFAHGTSELRSVCAEKTPSAYPQNAKRLPCEAWVSYGHCPYLGKCSFVHDPRLATDQSIRDSILVMAAKNPHYRLNGKFNQYSLTCRNNDPAFHWPENSSTGEAKRQDLYIPRDDGIDGRAFCMWHSMIHAIANEELGHDEGAEGAEGAESAEGASDDESETSSNMSVISSASSCTYKRLSAFARIVEG